MTWSNSWGWQASVSTVTVKAGNAQLLEGEGSLSGLASWLYRMYLLGRISCISTWNNSFIFKTTQSNPVRTGGYPCVILPPFKIKVGVPWLRYQLHRWPICGVWFIGSIKLARWYAENRLMYSPKCGDLKRNTIKVEWRKKGRALRRERPLKKISSWLLCCSTIETQTSSRRQLPQTLRSKKKFLLRKMDLRLLTFFHNFLNSWLLKLGEETEKLRPAPSVFDFWN